MEQYFPWVEHVYRLQIMCTWSRTNSVSQLILEDNESGIYFEDKKLTVFWKNENPENGFKFFLAVLKSMDQHISVKARLSLHLSIVKRMKESK